MDEQIMSHIEGMVNAAKQKHPIAMVHFGGILCGDFEHNVYIQNMPGLKDMLDPKTGFALIEEAVSIAESMSDNPLGYHEYEMITGAYHANTRTGEQPQGRRNFFAGDSWVYALGKKADYAQKALDAFKAGKHKLTNEEAAMMAPAIEDIARASMQEHYNLLKL